MTTSKDDVAASILKARSELERALVNLEHLPAFDSGRIAYAAHALNNFLSVINGSVELALASLKDNPDERIRYRLEGLQHATNLMHHTVNQLMNTSAAAKPPLIRDDVDLALLIQRACDYYQIVAARKQIRIVFFSADLPTVWTDRVAVAAVLDNLLSNAVKYSPPGKNVSVRVAAESADVVCSVQDEGPGLGPQDQARLFQRGVRLGPMPTAGEPSTGYGLAVAKELIDNLGGKIWCDSQPGQGARFSFSVPIAPSAQ
jgi:two-component system, sensor histidine kinase LadS